jgi:hypothetical protein
MSKISIGGLPLEGVVPDVRAGLDLAMEVTLNQQQEALGIANPKDTGRMSSSWAISKGGRSQFVRPEDWGAKGEERYEKYQYRRKITFEGNWYIINNVPYADVICYSYMALVPKAQKDWYTSIANQTVNVFQANLREVQS